MKVSDNFQKDTIYNYIVECLPHHNFLLYLSGLALGGVNEMFVSLQWEKRNLTLEEIFISSKMMDEILNLTIKCIHKELAKFFNFEQHHFKSFLTIISLLKNKLEILSSLFKKIPSTIISEIYSRLERYSLIKKINSFLCLLNENEKFFNFFISKLFTSQFNKKQFKIRKPQFYDVVEIREFNDHNNCFISIHKNIINLFKNIILDFKNNQFFEFLYSFNNSLIKIHFHNVSQFLYIINKVKKKPEITRKIQQSEILIQAVMLFHKLINTLLIFPLPADEYKPALTSEDTIINEINFLQPDMKPHFTISFLPDGMDKITVDVMHDIEKTGYQVYIVGGYAATLYNRQKHRKDFYFNDVDLITNAPLEIVSDLFKEGRISDMPKLFTYKVQNILFDIQCEVVCKTFSDLLWDCRSRDIINACLYISSKGDGYSPLDPSLSAWTNNQLLLNRGINLKSDPLFVFRVIKYVSRYNLLLPKKIQKKVIKLGPILSSLAPEKLLKSLKQLFLKGYSIKSLSLLVEFGLLDFLFNGLSLLMEKNKFNLFSNWILNYFFSADSQFKRNPEKHLSINYLLAVLATAVANYYAMSRNECVILLKNIILGLETRLLLSKKDSSSILEKSIRFNEQQYFFTEAKAVCISKPQSVDSPLIKSQELQ